MTKVSHCFIIYIITYFCSSQLYKEIEICSKTTKVIQFDRDESCMIGYGKNIICFLLIFRHFLVEAESIILLWHMQNLFKRFFSFSGFSISVVEEDGIQQLYITDVKAGGLAFAKGLFSALSCNALV